LQYNFHVCVCRGLEALGEIENWNNGGRAGTGRASERRVLRAAAVRPVAPPRFVEPLSPAPHPEPRTPHTGRGIYYINKQTFLFSNSIVFGC
jgi:hypothetical protein